MEGYMFLLDNTKALVKKKTSTVDVLPPIACHGGTRGSIARASAYAELDG